MNIFYLDKNAKLAAQYHCDKHVVKMILETAQLLCSSHHVLDEEPVNKDILYKLTHKNHPSAIWVRDNIHNYYWLYELFVELSNEYTFRYNKTHLTWTKLGDILKIPPININKVKQFNQPPQAMPEQYRSEDSVNSYREYYKTEKKDLLKYTNRKKPEFLNYTND